VTSPFFPAKFAFPREHGDARAHISSFPIASFHLDFHLVCRGTHAWHPRATPATAIILSRRSVGRSHLPVGFPLPIGGALAHLVLLASSRTRSGGASSASPCLALCAWVLSCHRDIDGAISRAPSCCVARDRQNARIIVAASTV